MPMRFVSIPIPLNIFVESDQQYSNKLSYSTHPSGLEPIKNLQYGSNSDDRCQINSHHEFETLNNYKSISIQNVNDAQLINSKSNDLKQSVQVENDSPVNTKESFSANIKTNLSLDLSDKISNLNHFINSVDGVDMIDNMKSHSQISNPESNNFCLSKTENIISRSNLEVLDKKIDINQVNNINNLNAIENDIIASSQPISDPINCSGITFNNDATRDVSYSNTPIIPKISENLSNNNIVESNASSISNIYNLNNGNYSTQLDNIPSNNLNNSCNNLGLNRHIYNSSEDGKTLFERSNIKRLLFFYHLQYFLNSKYGNSFNLKDKKENEYFQQNNNLETNLKISGQLPNTPISNLKNFNCEQNNIQLNIKENEKSNNALNTSILDENDFINKIDNIKSNNEIDINTNVLSNTNHEITNGELINSILSNENNAFSNFNIKNKCENNQERMEIDFKMEESISTSNGSLNSINNGSKYSPENQNNSTVSINSIKRIFQLRLRQKWILVN